MLRHTRGELPELIPKFLLEDGEGVEGVGVSHPLREVVEEWHTLQHPREEVRRQRPAKGHRQHAHHRQCSDIPHHRLELPTMRIGKIPRRPHRLGAVSYTHLTLPTSDLV